MSGLKPCFIMLCLLVWSVPAVAQQDLTSERHKEACKQHCAENCAGKGTFCSINCTARCDKYGGRH